MHFVVSMIGRLAPIIWPHNVLIFMLVQHYYYYYFHSGAAIVEAIKCYSCANDFIVWHWRHFFLKRNYGITTSDQNCAKPDYTPEVTHLCPSTCFIMYLNGTNRHNGLVTVLGFVRGCSSQFLTNDQHSQLGLGSHSRVSQIGNHLSSEFDMLQFDIMEHWCFCASDECNKQSCYSSNPYAATPTKRRQYFFDTYFSTDSASPTALSYYCMVVYLTPALLLSNLMSNLVI